MEESKWKATHGTSRKNAAGAYAAAFPYRL